MPLPETIYGQYQTGTVAVTSGSAVITGTGTVWNGQKVGATVVNVGDLFTIDDSRFYFIKSVDSATQITLDKPYSGSTASGQSYRIVYLAAAHFPADTATKVARTIERYERLSDTAESALQANNLVAGTGINLSTNVGNGNVTIASNCVMKSGDTMTGPLRSSQWNPLIIEGVNNSGKRIQGVDVNGNNMGFFNFVAGDNGSTLVGMSTYHSDPNGVQKWSSIQATVLPDGTASTYAPTPAANSNGNNIANTMWVNNRLNNGGKPFAYLLNSSVNSPCFSNGTQICIGYADLDTSAKTINITRAFKESKTVRLVISRSNGNDFAQACVVSITNTGFDAKSNSSTAKRFAYIAIGKGA